VTRRPPTVPLDIMVTEEQQLVVDAMAHHVEDVGPVDGYLSPRQRALELFALAVLIEEAPHDTIRKLRRDPSAYAAVTEDDFRRLTWAHVVADLGGHALRRWLVEQALVRARDGGYDVRLAATAVCLTWREAA
jgi:hypothetical protein